MHFMEICTTNNFYYHHFKKKNMSCIRLSYHNMRLFYPIKDPYNQHFSLIYYFKIINHHFKIINNHVKTKL